MSVRPHMYAVFGIDTFAGSLNYDEYCELSLAVSDEELEQHQGAGYFLRDVYRPGHAREWLNVEQVLYWGQMGSQAEILGMILHRGSFDSDLVRLLAIFHEEYQASGKRDVPVWDPEEQWLYRQRLEQQIKRGGARCGDIEWQWSWFYDSIVQSHHMWPVHAYCARHLFRTIGVDVDHREFKLMQVWDWT